MGEMLKEILNVDPFAIIQSREAGAFAQAQLTILSLANH
jgi:hypothetical protein